MSFRWGEKPNHMSSTVDPPTVTKRYWSAGGTRAYTLAYAVANTDPYVADPVAGILWRQDVQIDERMAYFWDVTIPYAKFKKQTGDFSFSFDTTGGTVHTKVSKESIARYPNTAPANKQLIGWHGSEVDGADIVVPALKLTCTFKHPAAIITIPKAKYLASITGYVNSDVFLTFAPGEVLFLGASGGDGTNSEASVQYMFACSANVSGLTIGDISNIAKKGHEVSWVAWEDAVDSNQPLVKPRTIYIERVYDTIPLGTAIGFNL